MEVRKLISILVLSKGPGDLQNASSPANPASFKNPVKPEVELDGKPRPEAQTQTMHSQVVAQINQKIQEGCKKEAKIKEMWAA